MKNIIKTLALATTLAFSGCSTDENAKFSVRGELLNDYIQKVGDHEFYRIEINDHSKFGGYKIYLIFGDSATLRQLDEQYTSRAELDSGRGDRIGVNPETSIFSLNKMILFPRNIKKLD